MIHPGPSDVTSARERREASQRLFPLAVVVFVLAGALLQAAILMSGYWQTVAPDRFPQPARPVAPQSMEGPPSSAVAPPWLIPKRGGEDDRVAPPTMPRPVPIVADRT
jgi:hypothetical protein